MSHTLPQALPQVEDPSSPVVPAPRVRPRGVHDQPLSILMMVASVWLFLCNAVLQYPADSGNVAHLPEMGAGVIVFLTGLVRLSRPRGRATDVLVLLIGLGLILSGFLGGYGHTGSTAVIFWNQVITGFVLVLMGLAGLALMKRVRDTRPAAAPARSIPAHEASRQITPSHTASSRDASAPVSAAQDASRRTAPSPGPPAEAGPWHATPRDGHVSGGREQSRPGRRR